MEQDSRSQACVNQPFLNLSLPESRVWLLHSAELPLSTASEVWEVQVSVNGACIADIKTGQVPQVYSIEGPIAIELYIYMHDYVVQYCYDASNIASLGFTLCCTATGPPCVVVYAFLTASHVNVQVGIFVTPRPWPACPFHGIEAACCAKYISI